MYPIIPFQLKSMEVIFLKISNSELPKISVITPTLNQGMYIRTTIESVLSQNYPNFEYIIIDGQSKDETINILKSYGNRINWISEPDNGQADAINKGIELTDGEIITFLNSDDYYLPDTLKIIGNAFRNPSILWVTGDYRIVDASDHSIQKFVIFYKRFLRSLPIKNILFLVNYIAQPSTFWRRDILSQIGGYFDITLRYTFDYDLWLRLLNINQPYQIRKALSVFRIHSQSKGGAEYRKQFEEELLVLRRYCNNPIIQRLHEIHNSLIVLLYRVLK